MKNFILKNSVILIEQISKEKLIVALAVFLLISSNIEFAEAQANAKEFQEACTNMVDLMKGPFGAMITAAAGVGAIIAAALGGFKTAWTLLVASCGAFILKGYIGLFFAGGCEAGGAG